MVLNVIVLLLLLLNNVVIYEKYLQFVQYSKMY